MSDILRFMGVNKDTTTAGPGKRLEFFTKGCIRGVIAPCQGCFNELTWTFEGEYRGLTVDEVVEICDRDAWNRQVTFCGGEPILQAKLLTETAKRLKEKDPTFHFVMYTAYKLDTLMKYGLKFTWLPRHGEGMAKALVDYCDSFHVEYNDPEQFSVDVKDMKKIEFVILSPEDVQELMKYIDIIVDGDFQMDKRLTTHEYMHDGWFIGSSNQRVFFAPATIKTGQMLYMHADTYNEQRSKSKHCRCCGHELKQQPLFCNITCSSRYSARKKEMALMGGA